jgi:hypothetical protein|tara:strand:+ start:190 stop:414 length:225 start_codon:yes stop_codon:yes gene_type:complete
MIKNPIVLALISATMVCLAYFLNNKCNDEEINKSTMVKLSVISVGVSLLTYHFLNSGQGFSLPIQDVLTGDPGF